MPSLRPSRLSAGRKVAPFLIATELLREGRRQWQEQLSERDQKRLVELLKASKGRPANLSAHEQKELKRLVGDLDLARFAKTAALVTAGARASRTSRNLRRSK